MSSFFGMQGCIIQGRIVQGRIVTALELAHVFAFDCLEILDVFFGSGFRGAEEKIRWKWLGVIF
jgi:hypothetical protein